MRNRRSAYASRRHPSYPADDTQRHTDKQEAFIYQLVMASLTALLGCAIAASGWHTLLPTIETLVADNDALPPADEAYLSLLLVCW